MLVLAASTAFYLSVGIRGRDVWAHALVTVREHRVSTPYFDIPFVAQPRTVKTLDVHLLMQTGPCACSTADRFEITVGADTRTFYGRLPRIPPPR